MNLQRNVCEVLKYWMFGRISYFFYLFCHQIEPDFSLNFANLDEVHV